MVWWALFSHQDQASLSAAEDLEPLALKLCLCGFQGFGAAILTEVIFKGAFTLMAVGEERKRQPPPLPRSFFFCCDEMRSGVGWPWAGASQWMFVWTHKEEKKKKEKTFHPLVFLGKQGHKWGRMPSVHVFSEPGHRDRDEVWDWDFTFELSVLFIWHTYCVTTEAVCHHQMAFCMSFHAI